MDAIVAAESALTQQKLELCSAALQSGETIRIRAFGASMLPIIWPGDVLVIASASVGEFVCGDIVVAKREQGLVIHRLIEKTAAHCITRGDAMSQNDPRICPGDILGKVVKVLRRKRVIVPQQTIQPLQRALAFLLCHSWVCRTIALRAKFAEQNHEDSLTVGIAH